MAQKSLKECTVTIKDGSTNSIELKVGEGNVTWSEKRTIEYTLNRGRLASVDGGAAREGDDQPIDVSFDIIFEYYKAYGTEDATPVEALKQTGAASAWTTTDSNDPCAPYAVNIEIVYDPDCTTGVTFPVETITLSVFRWESLDFDLSAGTISCSGTCQSTSASAVRSAS